MSTTLNTLREPVLTPSAGAAALITAGQGRFLNLGDHRAWIKVSAEQTGGDFLLAELEADFLGGVPPHIHRREDETFHILTGHWEFGIADRKIEARPGDTVFAPRDIPHTWRCVSPAGGRAMLTLTPGANFQAFAQTMAETGHDPQADMADPARVAALVALTARHGIEMLPTLG